MKIDTPEETRDTLLAAGDFRSAISTENEGIILVWSVQVWLLQYLRINISTTCFYLVYFLFVIPELQPVM